MHAERISIETSATNIKTFRNVKKVSKTLPTRSKKNYLAKYRAPNKSQQGGTADCCAGQNLEYGLYVSL